MSCCKLKRMLSVVQNGRHHLWPLMNKPTKLDVSGAHLLHSAGNSSAVRAARCRDGRQPRRPAVCNTGHWRLHGWRQQHSTRASRGQASRGDLSAAGFAKRLWGPAHLEALQRLWPASRCQRLCEQRCSKDKLEGQAEQHQMPAARSRCTSIMLRRGCRYHRSARSCQSDRSDCWPAGR